MSHAITRIGEGKWGHLAGKIVRADDTEKFYVLISSKKSVN
jgi:hypothetical protein